MVILSVSGLDDVVLGELANHIGADWKRVGVHLKLTSATLQQIEMDHHCTWDRIFDMLVKWRQSEQGNDETRTEILRRALTRCGYCINDPEGTEPKVKPCYFNTFFSESSNSESNLIVL